MKNVSGSLKCLFQTNLGDFKEGRIFLCSTHSETLAKLIDVSTVQKVVLAQKLRHEMCF